MPLADRKVLTFDAASTPIDFETGIVDYVQGKSKSASPQTNLEAYAILRNTQTQLRRGSDKFSDKSQLALRFGQSSMSLSSEINPFSESVKSRSCATVFGSCTRSV